MSYCSVQVGGKECAAIFGGFGPQEQDDDDMEDDAARFGRFNDLYLFSPG